MKLKSKFAGLSIVAIIIWLIPSLALSYPWPFQPTGTPHKIRQTIGAYRS